MIKIPTFLVCPHCGQPMKKNVEYHDYFYVDDPDIDNLPTQYTWEIYKCKKCSIIRIKSNNQFNPHDNWYIPDELRMTDSQKNVIKFIKDTLAVEFNDPPTKSNARLFIAKHLEHAEEMDSLYASTGDPFDEGEIYCEGEGILWGDQ